MADTLTIAREAAALLGATLQVHLGPDRAAKALVLTSGRVHLHTTEAASPYEAVDEMLRRATKHEERQGRPARARALLGLLALHDDPATPPPAAQAGGSDGDLPTLAREAAIAWVGPAVDAIAARASVVLDWEIELTAPDKRGSKYWLAAVELLSCEGPTDTAALYGLLRAAEKNGYEDVADQLAALRAELIPSPAAQAGGSDDVRSGVLGDDLATAQGALDAMIVQRQSEKASDLPALAAEWAREQLPATATDAMKAETTKDALRYLRRAAAMGAAEQRKASEPFPPLRKWIGPRRSTEAK